METFLFILAQLILVLIVLVMTSVTQIHLYVSLSSIQVKVKVSLPMQPLTPLMMRVMSKPYQPSLGTDLRKGL